MYMFPSFLFNVLKDNFPFFLPSTCLPHVCENDRGGSGKVITHADFRKQELGRVGPLPTSCAKMRNNTAVFFFLQSVWCVIPQCPSLLSSFLSLSCPAETGRALLWFFVRSVNADKLISCLKSFSFSKNTVITLLILKADGAKKNPHFFSLS